MTHPPIVSDSVILPKFSDNDVKALKKYFEFNERYFEITNEELISKLQDHPLWGPIIRQMSTEQRLAQNQRSKELQRAAIYEGKWDNYAQDLVTQGRAYARMNINYNDWYELVALAKVLLIPYIKRDFANDAENAIDIIDGMSKFIDYAMYGIAEAYFQEKNTIIRSNEERFRIIFEASNDIILLIGQDGEIIEINHATDYDVKDLIGKKIFDFQGNNNAEKMKSAVEYVFQQKKATVFDIEVPSEKGTKYYSSTISPVVDVDDKSVKLAVVISRDITDQKKAELELVQLNLTLENKVAERTEELNGINRELESFTYSVSHDLRSPLRAVNGFSAILKEESSELLNEEARDALDEIDKNVNKMGHLIDDLLEFSRIGKQNISRAMVDMHSLFEAVVEDFKKNSSKKVDVAIAPMKATHGDRTMLKQVVINLVSNAMKYSSKKDNPKIEIDFKEEKDNYIYCIKDNGVGFDMKYYDKLFGVFQRLHSTHEFEGTGVGLAIVQRIITRHSGKVWAEGKVDGGATFCFSLPKN